MKVQSVMDDTREIESVYTTDGQIGGKVGSYGVTRIVCYREAGQGGYVPWFAFYQGDALAARLSGHDVQVIYASEEARAF